MCIQAYGLSRCLTKVHDSMVAQIKTLHLDKGKTPGKSGPLRGYLHQQGESYTGQKGQVFASWG